jgi:hypothetical protein
MDIVTAGVVELRSLAGQYVGWKAVLSSGSIVIMICVG